MIIDGQIFLLGLTAFEDQSTWYLTLNCPLDENPAQMAPSFVPKYLKDDESIHEFNFSF